MQRILVATDGSPGANRAVDTAAELANATGFELVILTIGGNISGAERLYACFARQLSIRPGGSVDALRAKISQRYNVVGGTQKVGCRLRCRVERVQLARRQLPAVCGLAILRAPRRHAASCDR